MSVVPPKRHQTMWCNAAKLGWDVEDVDLGWVGVVDAVVGGLFDAVVFGEVAFDDTGVAAVSSFRVDGVEYFGDSSGDEFRVFVRGESPPAR